MTVWTIGHSTHQIGALIDLLRSNNIEVVADVRSSPFSRYSSQFNRDQLQRSLREQGIRYVFLGEELGGRPEDEMVYDPDGHVRYDLVASTERYRSGIQRLLEGAARFRVALLCGEEDPISCHRRRLIGRSLLESAVAVEHIRGDGTITMEADLRAREQSEFPDRQQLTLAGSPAWRSEHPARRPIQKGDGWTEFLRSASTGGRLRDGGQH
jgi:uncharacterized protein (DUF488 family)